MSLIVEDGTNISGAEAYVSVAYCDNYWSNRPTSAFSSLWAAATTSNKESAIRVATGYIDIKYSWLGIRQYDDQVLQWPRVGVYTDRGIDQTNQIPDNLKKSVAELSVRTLSADLLPDLDKSNYTKHEQVGPISVEYLMSAPSLTVFPVVTNLLRYLATSNSTVNVLRG